MKYCIEIEQVCISPSKRAEGLRLREPGLYAVAADNQSRVDEIWIVESTHEPWNLIGVDEFWNSLMKPVRKCPELPELPEPTPLPQIELPVLTTEGMIEESTMLKAIAVVLNPGCIIDILKSSESDNLKQKDGSF